MEGSQIGTCSSPNTSSELVRRTRNTSELVICEVRTRLSSTQSDVSRSDAAGGSRRLEGNEITQTALLNVPPGCVVRCVERGMKVLTRRQVPCMSMLHAPWFPSYIQMPDVRFSLVRFIGSSLTYLDGPGFGIGFWILFGSKTTALWIREVLSKSLQWSTAVDALQARRGQTGQTGRWQEAA